MKDLRISATKAERTDSVLAYYADIRKYSVSVSDSDLSSADADTLIKANLRFVVSIARQYDYCKGAMSLADLIQAGNIGLIKAVETFDATKGFRFTTHAVSYIRKHIILAIKHESRVVRDYHSDAPNSHTSMDDVVSDMDNTPIADVLCQSEPNQFDALDADELKADIKTILETLLNENEQNVVTAIFGIGRVEECRSTIAKRMRMSEERIRQILEHSLYKIRNNQNAMHLLASYLG